MLKSKLSLESTAATQFSGGLGVIVPDRFSIACRILASGGVLRISPKFDAITGRLGNGSLMLNSPLAWDGWGAGSGNRCKSRLFRSLQGELLLAVPTRDSDY